MYQSPRCTPKAGCALQAKPGNELAHVCNLYIVTSSDIVTSGTWRSRAS